MVKETERHHYSLHKVILSRNNYRIIIQRLYYCITRIINDCSLVVLRFFEIFGIT